MGMKRGDNMSEKISEIQFEKKLNKLILFEFAILLFCLIGFMFLAYQSNNSKELAPQEFGQKTEKVCIDYKANKNESV